MKKFQEFNETLVMITRLTFIIAVVVFMLKGAWVSVIVLSIVMAVVELGRIAENLKGIVITTETK